jgi:RES domain-containing protein
MILWRISNHATLDGGGGLRASARWHTRGRRVVYCAPNPATALLEILVRLEIELADMPALLKLLKIEAPDDLSRERINPHDLPAGWRTQEEITRRLGDTWLAAAQTAVLEVPCAIVPETTNVLINPAHPDSARIRIVRIEPLAIDERLTR